MMKEKHLQRSAYAYHSRCTIIPEVENKAITRNERESVTGCHHRT